MQARTPEQVYRAVRDFLSQRTDNAPSSNRRRGSRMELDAGPLFAAGEADDEGRTGNGIEPLPRGRYFPYGDSVALDPTRTGRTFLDHFRLNYVQPHWFTNASIVAVPNGLYVSDISPGNPYICAWVSGIYPVDEAANVPAILRVRVTEYDGDGAFGIIFRATIGPTGALSGYWYNWNNTNYDLWRIDDNVPTKLAVEFDDAPVELVAEFTGVDMLCYGIDSSSGQVGLCVSSDAVYKRGVVGVGFQQTDAIVGAPFEVRTE